MCTKGQRWLGSPGGSVVDELLRKLEDDLVEYFGLLNELVQGATVKVPQKPIPYAFYQMMKQTGLPLIAGGIYDQPYIWIQQYAICQQTESLYGSVNRHEQSNSEPSPALRAVQDRIAGITR